MVLKGASVRVLNINKICCRGRCEPLQWNVITYSQHLAIVAAKVNICVSHCFFVVPLAPQWIVLDPGLPVHTVRLTLVSSTADSPAQKYNGTKFFLDEWCKRLPKVGGPSPAAWDFDE